MSRPAEGEPTLVLGDLTAEVASTLKDAGRIAWDVETSGLDWRSDRLGTCQLDDGASTRIIVQLNETRPENLCVLLEDPNVLKVFHHAPFDLRFMVSTWGVSPRSILCTKVASKLLRPTVPNRMHSLQALLEARLGVVVEKGSVRTSDWLARRLNEEQIRYAASDVAYLLPLLDKLSKELQTQDLYRLYLHCCEFLPTRVQLELGDYPDVFGY